jgi:hypothetical protein
MNVSFGEDRGAWYHKFYQQNQNQFNSREFQERRPAHNPLGGSIPVGIDYRAVRRKQEYVSWTPGCAEHQDAL